MEFPINAILGAAVYLVVSWFLKQRRKKDTMKKIRMKQVVKWGIYNTKAKQFQFGIQEDTADEAVDALYMKIGKDAYKWRFSPRRMTVMVEDTSVEMKGLGDYLPGPVVDLKVRNAEISSAQIAYLNLEFDTDKKEVLKDGHI